MATNVGEIYYEVDMELGALLTGQRQADKALIVVNTGRAALAANTGATMATKGFTTNVSAASPVRVHVWKVTA